MFMIMGTFAIVVFMLIVGFIGGMFSSSEESESSTSEESYSEYATA